MPAWGDIVNSLLLNRQDLVLRGQQIQGRQMALEQQQQQMQLDNQYREAQLKGALLNPTVNNPNTTSIGDTEDSRSPQEKALKDFDQRRKQAQVNVDLANRFGKDKELKIWTDALNHAETHYNEVAKEVYKNNEDKATQIANMLRDVNSAADLSQVVSNVKDKYGPGAAFNLDRTLPHDPNSGSLLWNETAKRVAATERNRYTSMAEAEHKRHDVATEASAEQLRQIERDRDAESKRFHNAEISLRQQGLKATAKYREDVLKASGLKYDRTLVDKTQKEIDKVATDFKLGDFKAASDVASRVQAKLLDPAQGYTSVSPEDARQLVEQAKRVQTSFRAFGGAGKLQEGEIRNMNSFLEGLEKWEKSIGSGDPILSQDQMLNLTETMRNVYNDRNSEQVKQELQRKNVLAERGNNPNWVVSRGNIDDLKESGRAYEVTVGDKKLLAIIPPGKTKKDLTKSDFYEIPQPPKMPTFVDTATE